jgi:hypothetical protein
MGIYEPSEIIANIANIAKIANIGRAEGFASTRMLLTSGLWSLTMLAMNSMR